MLFGCVSLTNRERCLDSFINLSRLPPEARREAFLSPVTRHLGTTRDDQWTRFVETTDTREVVASIVEDVDENTSPGRGIDCRKRNDFPPPQAQVNLLRTLRFRHRSQKSSVQGHLNNKVGANADKGSGRCCCATLTYDNETYSDVSLLGRSFGPNILCK